jgi:hypothetical protein
MPKYLITIIIALTLFVAACDRFEHTFQPQVTLEVSQILFNNLQAAFDSIDATDVSEVMHYYAEDYLHNGQEKADREAWFVSLLTTRPDLTFDVNLLNFQDIGVDDTLSEVNWQLKVTDSADQIVADSTFYGEEIIKRNGAWLLYGNRAGCCPPITYKQRVFIETFTYTTCPNCPAVEALLHQLQLAYPYNLSYLEYHLSDPLDVGNLDVYGYYGYPDMPSVIFQGETKIIGNNTSNEQFFNQLAAQIAGTESRLNLANLDYSIVGQTLSGTVRLNVLDETLDTSQLKLKYAIIDKESADYTNFEGIPCANVVLIKGTKSLVGADLGQAVNFSLSLSSLPNAYNGTLPQDSYLVIWAQVTPDPFNNNATVYNALESAITVNRK